jgi:hypothetical protein
LTAEVRDQTQFLNLNERGCQVIDEQARAKATCDQPRLVPASAAVPTAAKQQNDDYYNDEKRGGIHV